MNELAPIWGGDGISTDWADAVPADSITSTSEVMIRRNNPGVDVQSILGNCLLGTMGPFDIK
jgi:hypothetical protein